MTFDYRTLEEISDLICGDNGPYYRKGLELPIFFRNLDFIVLIWGMILKNPGF